MKTAILIVLAGAIFGVGGFRLTEDELNTAHIPSVQNVQAFLLPQSQTTYLPIRDFAVAEPVVNARAAILVDGVSNRTLFVHNPDQELPIASITKLMTAIVVIKNFGEQEIFTVAAEDMNVDALGADFVQGDRLTRDELLKMMLVRSSNDAATVFANHAYRQGIDLVDLMNQEASALGMHATQFSEGAGLNDRETYSTVTDVALLARAALQYPLIRNITITARADVATLDGTSYHVTTTNQLLGVLPRILLGKTGNTPGALGTMLLVVAVDEDDYLISIVLGTPDRFGETRRLIQWGNEAHQWN